MRSVSWGSWTLVACAVLSALGCGGSSEYELAPVSGVVTLDGKPMVVDVVFQPASTGKSVNPGPTSMATTGADGHFELKTGKGEAGAVVGPNKVMIYTHHEVTNTSSDTSGPAPKELIPAKYNAQTELSLDVPKDGTTTADFKLTTK